MPRRGTVRRRLPLGWAAAGAFVAALTLIPLWFVIVTALQLPPGDLAGLLFRPRVGELLVNTLQLGVVAVALCGVLGTGAAWLTERTDLPARGFFRVLMTAPLAVPAFVNAYAWVSFVPWARDFTGAVIIVTLSYFPFVYLPAAAVLGGIDPALEEAARTLGKGPWATFLLVVLPQLRPAVLGGMLLVGLHLLAEFGALQMLRYPTFTTAIYDQYQATFDGVTANVYAFVLVLLCITLLVGEAALRGRGRYARLGGGAARTAATSRLGPWKPAALGALLMLVATALGLPLVSLGYWLVTGSSTEFPLGALSMAAATSLGLGAAGALTATVAAIPVAWLLIRHPGRFSMVVERSTYVASSLPGIVVALALVTLTVHIMALYQSVWILIAGYTIVFLPRAVVNVRAAMAQAPPVLDDAARALGLGPIAVLRRVTLPLIARGLGAAAALVFMAVVTELTATLLLAPTGTETLATEFWSNADSVAYGAAAPYAVLMVLLSAPATYILMRENRR